MHVAHKTRNTPLAAEVPQRSMKRTRATASRLPNRTLDEWVSDGSIRKRDEDTPDPKVSAVDVVQATRTCTPHAAAQALRMLGLAGDDYLGARDLVMLLWRLQGNEEMTRNSASVLVRYLGGDLSLVDEVLQNHAAQLRLAEEAPEHPARIFGEAVEGAGWSVLAPAATAAIAAAVTAAVKDAVNAANERYDDRLVQEVQRTHVWSFSKASWRDELAKVGRVIGGSELAQLDDDEHVVSATDFLRDQLSAGVWATHGRKVKSLFTLELKRAKLAECEREGIPPYVAFNQGEHRIVYTEADHELMEQVLRDLMPRLARIAGRDELLRQGQHRKQRRTQRRIHEFFAKEA